jgi:hypothetical protein
MTRILTPTLLQPLPILALCLLASLTLLVPQSTAQRPAPQQENRLLSHNQIGPQRRVALVIGNGAYQNTKPLKNPPNDAALVAAVLRKLGFEVTIGADRSQREMKQLIREFGRRLRDTGGVGLFYFAGHGVQSRGRNYLIPVDADIQTEADLEDTAVNLNYVLDNMDDAQNALNIAILDACRNNSFARSFRSAEEGLAQVKAPTGTLIAYATAPDSVAADGDGANSPYTEELARQMQVAGVFLETMFRRLTERVSARTGGRQEPWFAANVKGDFYFGGSSNIADSAALPTGWSGFSSMAKALLPYDTVHKMSEGLALVTINHKVGFINESGKLVIPARYDEDEECACSFSEGLAAVKRNDKWGYVDTTGKEIIAPKYQHAYNFHNGLAVVTQNNKSGMIDKTGRVVIGIKYDTFEGYFEGLVGAKINGKAGFLDGAGRVAIPFTYEEATSFSQGLAMVKANGKWGFIDKTGKFAIRPEYEVAGYFKDGVGTVGIPVADDGEDTEYNWGLINKSGKLLPLVPLHPEDLDSGDERFVDYYYNFIGEFSEGLAAANRHGKQGFIDNRGRGVVPLKYDGCDCGSFSDGIGLVSLNDKFGYVDKNGVEVIPIKYDEVWCNAFRRQGFIGVKLNGKKGFVDLQGNEYWDF